MFYNNEKEMIVYAHCIEAMKVLNRDYYNLRKSSNYKLGMVISTTLNGIKKGDFQYLKKRYSQWGMGGKSAKKLNTQAHSFPLLESDPHIYFTKERIAVYTVIFGNYDKLLEPILMPDNIDYYVITDQELNLSSSKWKKVDISNFHSELQGLSNVEKNRFFKMKPFLVFNDYKYSIYIDGNIQVVTDLTEYINLIGKYDIATHQHFCRDCVYDECEAIELAKKESKENLTKHRDLFLRTRMPKHYGLMECNVIARHHTDLCRHIMENWWQEFIGFSKRDQLSLPHVLFMEGIDVVEIATLGPNVFLNPSIRVVIHN